MKSNSVSKHRSFSSVLIAGVSLLGMIFGALYVVTLVQLEDGMEKINLIYWLDAEVQRYSLDWAELGDKPVNPIRLTLISSGRIMHYQTGCTITRRRDSTSMNWATKTNTS